MYSVAVLVSSDRAYNGVYPDKSGAYIRDKMTAEGYEVTDLTVLPDDFDRLKNQLEKYVREGVSLVFTTGGTGFAVRDVTPEATKAVVERETPGISEAIRAKSLTITPHGMLSRAVSGIKEKTLIINLPGSVKAVAESLDVVLPALRHGLGILTGTADN